MRVIMAVLGYCEKCKEMVPLSFMGRCKKCGELAKRGTIIADTNWNQKTPEEQALFIENPSAATQPASNASEMDSNYEMWITTCQKFEGIEIEAYLGTVSGTDIYLVGGAFGGGLANQESLFGNAFKNAKKKMFDKAKAAGANAVIGMQTSFTSPGNLNDMIVVVTGTAVKLANIEE